MQILLHVNRNSMYHTLYSTYKTWTGKIVNAPKNAYNVQWVTRRGKMIFQGAWTLLFTYITIFLKLHYFFPCLKFHKLVKVSWFRKQIGASLILPKNKWTNLFCLLLTLHGKQIKFVRSFFGKIYGAPICFLVLSDL